MKPQNDRTQDIILKCEFERGESRMVLDSFLKVYVVHVHMLS